MDKAKKQSKKIFITKKEEISLPGAPKVEPGEMAMRMVYNNGKSQDIIAPTMPEIITKAYKQARKDGFNFKDGKHIVSWERIA